MTWNGDTIVDISPASSSTTNGAAKHATVHVERTAAD